MAQTGGLPWTACMRVSYRFRCDALRILRTMFVVPTLAAIVVRTSGVTSVARGVRVGRLARHRAPLKPKLGPDCLCVRRLSTSAARGMGVNRWSRLEAFLRILGYWLLKETFFCFVQKSHPAGLFFILTRGGVWCCFLVLSCTPDFPFN